MESVLLSHQIATREAHKLRASAVSDSGSRMGAEALRQPRSDAVYESNRQSLTCVDSRKQVACTLVLPVRDEEAARQIKSIF